MIYREIETELYGEPQKHIIIQNGDGSFKSFPADPNNPEYQNFLEQLEKDK